MCLSPEKITIRFVLVTRCNIPNDKHIMYRVLIHSLDISDRRLIGGWQDHGSVEALVSCRRSECPQLGRAVGVAGEPCGNRRWAHRELGISRGSADDPLRQQAAPPFPSVIWTCGVQGIKLEHHQILQCEVKSSFLSDIDVLINRSIIKRNKNVTADVMACRKYWSIFQNPHWVQCMVRRVSVDMSNSLITVSNLVGPQPMYKSDYCCNWRTIFCTACVFILNCVWLFRSISLNIARFSVLNKHRHRLYGE